MTDVAKEAFASSNYGLAVEMYERSLKVQGPNVEVLLGYGDSLARCGRIRDAFDVYSRCMGIAGVAIERLKHLTSALLEDLVGLTQRKMAAGPFNCATCEGTLHLPVTASCGHTHCRSCYEAGKCCRACGQVLGDVGETNVLVQRLVEKWWPREAEASKARHDGDVLMKEGHIAMAVERYNLAVKLGELIRYKSISCYSSVQK